MKKHILKYILKYIPIYISVLFFVLCPLSVSAASGNASNMTINIMEVQFAPFLNVDPEYRFSISTSVNPSDPSQRNVSAYTWYHIDYLTQSNVSIPTNKSFRVYIDFSLSSDLNNGDGIANSLSFGVFCSPTTYTNLSGVLNRMHFDDSGNYVISDSYNSTYPDVQSSRTDIAFNTGISSTDNVTNYYRLDLTFIPNSSAGSTISYFNFSFKDVEILAGEPGPSFPSYKPTDGSVFESVGGKEDELTSGALDDYNSVKGEVFDTSDLNDSNQYFKGFVAVSKMMDYITTIPFIRRIFKYSVLIGCAGFVLGLVNVIISKDWSPRRRGGD